LHLQVGHAIICMILSLNDSYKQKMSKTLENLHYQELPDCFSDTELEHLVSGTDARRHALVKRAIAKGEIVRLKRGRYCLAERFRRRPLNLFAVAQRLYGPSYVSFESALSYHGWIPESVPAVTSACAGRSCSFETELALFDFRRVPARLFLAHVDRIVDGDAVFFMATPWRAVADYVYINRKDWRGVDPLIKSLRIEGDDFGKTTREELESIDLSFGKRRVTRFLRGVIRELDL